MTIVINGITIADPWDAVRTIVKRLPNEQLGGELWLTLLRQIKRSRTVGMPEARGEVASNAVLVREPIV